MTDPSHILGLFTAYLLGSLPVGLLVARTRGIDIRTVGSGNIGATNVFRSISKPLGLLTFAADAVKGFLPAFFFPGWFAAGGDEQLYGLLFGCAAIAGHNWPIFLRFKGGKGVATSAGVLMGVVPSAAFIGLAAWVLLLLASGYVAVASMGAALTIAAGSWFLYDDRGLYLPTALTVLGLLVVYTHRSNLKRLRAGTEHRFTIWRGRGTP